MTHPGSLDGGIPAPLGVLQRGGVTHAGGFAGEARGVHVWPDHGWQRGEANSVVHPAWPCGHTAGGDHTAEAQWQLWPACTLLPVVRSMAGSGRTLSPRLPGLARVGVSRLELGPSSFPKDKIFLEPP